MQKTHERLFIYRVCGDYLSSGWYDLQRPHWSNSSVSNLVLQFLPAVFPFIHHSGGHPLFLCPSIFLSSAAFSKESGFYVVSKIWSFETVYLCFKWELGIGLFYISFVCVLGYPQYAPASKLFCKLFESLGSEQLPTCVIWNNYINNKKREKPR